jgi:hypothetical protein
MGYTTLLWSDSHAAAAAGCWCVLLELPYSPKHGYKTLNFDVLTFLKINLMMWF